MPFIASALCYIISLQAIYLSLRTTLTGSYIPLDHQGYTSTVYHLPNDPTRVCKSFNQAFRNDLYPVEKAVYERFTAHGPPPSILAYYGPHPSLLASLILDYAEQGNLWNYLGERDSLNTPPPNATLLLRWARQATEALAFAHDLDIFNGDIHPSNLFLDGALNLKVGDWAGASIEGSLSRSSYRPRYRLVDAEGRDVPSTEGVTVRTEIFALGSALYFLVTGKEVWGEIEGGEEIRRLFAGGEFPRTDGLLVLGEVVERCWMGGFGSMEEVRQVIGEEEGRMGLRVQDG
ncbi:hypothetical protein B0A50_07749 [Salinomyces thailandicus]|uniref:Protein kinase domain-containing protein n=1 Tax=Salinomyces thailandicus TaxID=706561 RepID=A0A4V5N3D7_9PEZI|nr:hypothetical protein B0A50_07749 [Salinomyces thailandica]